MPERQAALEALDLTVHNEALAALQNPRHVGAVEPAGGGVAARVAQEGGERHATTPGRRWTDTGDLPRARVDLSHGEASERRQMCPILVSERQEEEGVLDGVQA